jgi:hypothetical protein
VSGEFVALVYVALGVADLGLSLVAFRLGVSEGNPFLALMERYGLFVPTKLLLTIVVAALIGLLYPRAARVRFLCWSALMAMTGVDVYHIVGLSARLY